MQAAASCSVRPLQAASLVQQRRHVRADGSRLRFSTRRALVRVAAARQPAQPEGGSSDGSSTAGRQFNSQSHAAEPQPRLQAWLLQQQGLTAGEADRQARRLARVYGSQQAALDGLPATFAWCRQQGLTGPRTAAVLDRIASGRRENVVQFAATAQADWQLIDSYIAAYVEPLRQAGARLPKHTSLAGVLGSRSDTARALAMPPGHVAAWLAAVAQQLKLPAAAISGLLLGDPSAVIGAPDRALAAIDWAVGVLKPADPAAFLAVAPSLLKYKVQTLQDNLESLQRALGWTAEEARQLVLKQPQLLAAGAATVQSSAAWLQQLFPAPEELAAVINRGPQLLFRPVAHLQGNADTLQLALGWQEGDGQLAACIAARPQAFATVRFSGQGTAHKLRFLSRVVGISVEDCLVSSSSYLKTCLETMAAEYMLVQARAPELLWNRDVTATFA